MAILRLADHTLSYDESGDGPGLVLIAGLASTRLMWWKQSDVLSRGFKVIRLDNRGIGDSSPLKEPFTIADMADDAAALIGARNLGPCHVAGISMGGFIAGTLAVRHPQVVQKLILISTSAGGPAHVPPDKEIIQLLLSDRASDVPAYVRRVYTAIAGPDYMLAHPEDLEQIVRNALDKPLSMETYLYQLNAVNQYSSATGIHSDLDRITAPTLIIHGDKDPLVPYPNGQYLAAHIRGAQLLTYAGVGHLPPIEASERFNSDVQNFLNKDAL